MMERSVLFIGEDKPGSRSRQRLRAMRDLGHSVSFLRSHPQAETYETPPTLERRIRYRLRRPADTAGLNREIARRIASGAPPDIVWIDYVLTIRPRVLAALRSAWPKAAIVWYSEDDMMRPRNSSVFLDRSVHLFDLWVTTKSFNAMPEEMPARGARRVLFVDNSYDPRIHRPVEIDRPTVMAFGAEASFVGTFEKERAASLLRIADSGISVRVWGNGWHRLRGTNAKLNIEDRAVYGDDLARVHCASSLNLAFLRKINRDRQTCRTIEIPACGGFMLHERTDEATRLLAEGHEAAFFSDDDELVERCRYWLDRPCERQAVAAAGRKRVVEGGFSHGELLERIFGEIELGRA